MDIKTFLSTEQEYKKQSNILNGYKHFVYDTANKRILGISLNTHTLNKASDSFLNTTMFLHGKPCTLTEGFDSLHPFLYCIDEDNFRIFKSPEPLTDNELYYYALISEKIAALDYIILTIANYRRRFFANTIFQNEIYEFKFQEAIEILKLNLNEITDDIEFQYPYVCGYAKIEGLDLQTAAKEIKLRYEFVYTKSAVIENLRLKYTKKLIECQDITLIPVIMEEFSCQGSLYGKF
jgi:hypothetical protein